MHQLHSLKLTNCHRQKRYFLGKLFGKKNEQEPAQKTQEQKQNQFREPRTNNHRKFPAKSIVAFSSGKGGVGKSTCSVNVAIALNEMGLRVGVLDGDLHSPSIPILMNLKDPIREIEYDEERHVEVMLPPMNYNIKCMSIGFIKPEGKAIIWKGPIIHYFLSQMIDYIKWGKPDLDVLIVDFPPGTGDTQLSLCQLLKFDGAVIITTPQDVALEDVRRGIDMFHQVNIPIVGVIENMSHYHCPQCGHKDFIFGEDGYKKLVTSQKPARMLGQIPLHTDVRKYSDSGTPIVLTDPKSPVSLVYKDIAQKINTHLQNRADINTNFVVE